MKRWITAAVVVLSFAGGTSVASGHTTQQPAPKFLLVQGSPCNVTVAAYFALLVQDTHSTVNACYRGQDAAAILHAHGKHTQAELYRELPAGVANPPGRSTHELRSDGVAYRGPIGRKLEWWQEGLDVNDNNVLAMKLDALFHGWVLFQPYKTGVEFHHLNFLHRPIARRAADKRRLLKLRATLPRH